MDETFLLTNIAPQVGEGFNRHCEPYNALASVSLIAMSRLGVVGRLLPQTDK